MEYNQKKLICFDLDGTLTRVSSWETFNTMLGISPEEDKRLFDLYIGGHHTYKEWIVEIMNQYSQNDKVTRQQIEELANNLSLREGAEELISFAKNKGYQVIIVSGSIDVVTKVIAAKLNVREYFSTNKAIFNKDDEFIEIETMGDERESKLLLLREYCLKNGIDIEDVIAVGDGGNDKEIFVNAKGVLLEENKELNNLAWRKVTDLLEIKDLL